MIRVVQSSTKEAFWTFPALSGKRGGNSGNELVHGFGAGSDCSGGSDFLEWVFDPGAACHSRHNYYSQLSYFSELISITVTVTVTVIIFPGINYKTVMWQLQL